MREFWAFADEETKNNGELVEESVLVGKLLAEELTKVRAELYRTQKTMERLRFPAIEILDFTGFHKELQNLRREIQTLEEKVDKEKEEEAYREMATKLIAVLDAFDRFSAAAQEVKENNTVQKWIEGFGNIAFLFRKVLEGYGITAITAEGKAFDPYFHLAVGSVEDDAKPDGTVIAEKTKGYLFHQKLLRPAEVIISRRKKT